MDTTIVISIDEPVTGHLGYPTHLHYFNTETGEYLTDDSISCALSADLDIAADRIAESLHRQGTSTDALRSIGRELYDLINDCDVGNKWFELYRNNNSGEPLRVYLDIKPEILSKLPWELMMDPDHRGVFNAPGHLPMRGTPLAPASPADHTPPLPIHLLIIKCKMRDDADQDSDHAQEEIDAIIEAIGKSAGIWHTYVLIDPTNETLAEFLKKYPINIIHFIAHNTDEDESGFRLNDRERITISRLESLITEMKRRPSLLFFNGCRTTQMIRREVYQKIGCRAIIGNQGIVYGAPSVLFAQAFYEKLAEGESIDQAMRKARTELYHRSVIPDRNDGSDDYFDWGMPTLTLYGAPQDVITYDLRTLAAWQAQLIRNGIRSSVRLIVDRFRTRDRIWRVIYEDDKPRKQLILITGKERYGKSLLLQSVLLTCRLRGSLGVMVDLRGTSGVTRSDGRKRAEDVISLICEAFITEAAHHRPQNYPITTGESDTSQDIIQQLNSLKNRLSERPRNYRSSTHQDSRATSPLDNDFAELLRVLARQTQAGKVIVALNHVELIYPADLSLIRNSLLKPISSGYRNLYFMLAATDTAAAAINPSAQDSWGEAVESVVLKGFKPYMMRTFMHEWAARKGEEWKKWDREAWSQIARVNTPDPTLAPATVPMLDYPPYLISKWSMDFEEWRMRFESERRLP